MRPVANSGGGSAHAILNVVSHMCWGTGEGLRPRPYLPHCAWGSQGEKWATPSIRGTTHSLALEMWAKY